MKPLILSLFISMNCFAVDMLLSFDDIPGWQTKNMTNTEKQEMLIKGIGDSGVRSSLFFFNTGFTDIGEIKSSIKAFSKIGEIGNHTHLHKSILKSSKSEFENQILSTENILKEAGIKAIYFRYPFLEKGNNKDKRTYIQNVLMKNKLLDAGVTIDSFDWYFQQLIYVHDIKIGSKKWEKFKKFYIQFVLDIYEEYEAVRQKFLPNSKHVILFHLNEITAHTIGEIISALKKKGVNFVSAEKVYPFDYKILGDDTFFERGYLLQRAKLKGYKIPKEFESKYLRKKIEDFFNQI